VLIVLGLRGEQLLWPDDSHLLPVPPEDDIRVIMVNAPCTGSMDEPVVIGAQDAEIARVMVDGASDVLDVVYFDDHGPAPHAPFIIKKLTGVATLDHARCSDDTED